MSKKFYKKIHSFTINDAMILGLEKSIILQAIRNCGELNTEFAFDEFRYMRPKEIQNYINEMTDDKILKLNKVKNRYFLTEVEGWEKAKQD